MLIIRNLYLLLLSIILTSAAEVKETIKLFCKFSNDKQFGKTCTFSNVTLLEINKSHSIELQTKNGEIKKVIFENSTLKFLPTELFKEFPKMESLSIHNSNLTLDSADFFKSAGKLKNLNFSGNHLESIGNDVFSLLSDLESIDLSHNLLEWINKHWFRQSPKIKSINFSYNNIFMIDPSILKYLGKLKELNLIENLCVNEAFKVTSKTVDLLNKELKSCYQTYSRIGVPYKKLVHLEASGAKPESLESISNLLEKIDSNVSTIFAELKKTKMLDSIESLEKTLTVYHMEEEKVLNENFKAFDQNLTKFEHKHWKDLVEQFNLLQKKFSSTFKNLTKNKFFDDEAIAAASLFDNLKKMEASINNIQKSFDKRNSSEANESAECDGFNKIKVNENMEKQISQQKSFMRFSFWMMSLIILMNLIILVIIFVVGKRLVRTVPSDEIAITRLDEPFNINISN